MIHAHADDLFAGMKVKGCYQFRLTRNADLSVDAEDVEDLARALRGELCSRRYGDAVRLEVVDTCPRHLTNYLLKQFGLSENELYNVSGPVNLTRLFSVTGLASHPELQNPPFTPTIPKLLQKQENLFNVLGKLDVLLLHPFESFTPVIDLLRQAAKDPNVLAIKQTLYRSGANSEIVDALVEAARNGKEVTAVIELRARFDEESNLQLASRLQQAGAVVIYGVVGFKTHAKMMLILRREDGELRRYAHLGTGNYHAGNARLYTDYSLLTADVALCEDLHKLFNQLIGMGKTLRMKKLLHAPFTLKKNLLEMINREAAQAAEGKPAHIMAKVNALTDPKVIRALYKASQAGVKIDLVVRGMCCLRPGVPGVSHNIQVRSIIGRFLEHSRIYYFLNGGDEKLYLSSADWMERNLDMRVETCFPVEGKKLVLRVKKELELYMADNTQAWVLQSDGSYQRLAPTGNQNARNAQAMLLERLCTPVINSR
jgi:polyphosphate kinase